MFASSGALATAGAIAGIAGIISAAFVGLWAQRFAVKSKEKESADAAAKASQSTQLSTTQFGLTVIERAVMVTEAQNKDLRLDLLAAEKRVDGLQSELRVSQRECAELRRDNEKLRGPHE